MVFDAYAQYYNLLYTDKPYSEEVDYVFSLINQYSITRPKSLLDIGCGTGNHDFFFAKKNIDVTGIDVAPEMIKIAKSKKLENLKFRVADATNFSLSRKFDIVVSLFHAINYQVTNELLQRAFSCAATHINPGGLFIFDSWYGPAVLSERPSSRLKVLENEKIKVTRTATPSLFPNENLVEVSYDILVHEKDSMAVDLISEKHKVRYLFKPEIEKILGENLMELVYCEEWMTGKALGVDTWAACFIARKLS